MGYPIKEKLFCGAALILGIIFLSSFMLKDGVVADAQKNEIYVVLLAGQSNMAGHGNYDALDDDIRARIEKVSNRVLLSTSNNPKKDAKPFAYYTSKDEKYDFSKHFGPELLLGLTLAEANPMQHYLLIKEAVGGTSLYGAWNPEWTAEKAAFAERGEPRTSLKLFDAHIQKIKANLEAMEKSGQSYKIIGLVWMQGESDTNKEITASSYKLNLQKLIAGYRNILAIDNLPVVIGQVNPLPRKFKEGPGLVRQAMEEIAKEDNHVEVIKTSSGPDWSDYPKHSDNLHYNTEGQKRLGIAFGKALINYQSH